MPTLPPQVAESSSSPGPRRWFSSYGISGGVHTLALLLLAVTVSHRSGTGGGDEIVVTSAGDVDLNDRGLNTNLDGTSETTPSGFASSHGEVAEIPIQPLPTTSQSGAAASQPALPAQTFSPSMSHVLMKLSQAPRKGSVASRSKSQRVQRLREHGGNQASEAAVKRGLNWIAQHQRPDGSWRFDLRQTPCQGRCKGTGTIATTTGATGLALLPLLGAGSTHRIGPHRAQVDSGLKYLTSRIQSTPHGADLQEGTMYAQALAAIALCEAYDMSRDPKLRPVAQQALDFIVWAQHRQGGWRYSPHEPGDISVSTWQLQALKSGQWANLPIKRGSIKRLSVFLDRMQTMDGAAYGYQRPGAEAATTACGLLCRMYEGWPRDHPALVKGVDNLLRTGPSNHNLYYNYYASLVLHHYGGPAWKKWNPKLRDYLIRTQAQAGHESGSWYFVEPHSIHAGRLYHTAMAVLILEIYYRYEPLYELRSVDDHF